MPDELVQDLEDDRVVLFCGSGISMGAGLPDYNGLVRYVYASLGATTPSTRDRAWLWPDRMLGELELRSHPGSVRSAIAERLAQPPTTLEMHHALLRLSRLTRHAGLRLVTTNFDTYFEAADRNLIPGIDLHSGPVLPIPRDDRTASWRSVVYLHGRLETAPHPNDHLIATSADFGRAYLTDGWAARFISRLFADFSVLFIGYSLNDPVLRYMTDAFAAEALAARRRSLRPPAYIFVPYSGRTQPSGEDWRDRGVEPIFYHHARHHKLLRETIKGWAAAREDWLSNTAAIISRFASSTPEIISPSDLSNFLWAVFGRPNDEGYGAKVLSEINPPPPIEWLNAIERHEKDLEEQYSELARKARDAGERLPPRPILSLRLLTVSELMGDGEFPPSTFYLAQWLTRHLSNNKLIDWAAAQLRAGRRLHPRFRSMIRHRLQGENPTASTSVFRFWSIASAEGIWTNPAQTHDHAWDIRNSLKAGVPNELIRVELLALLRPYLRLRPTTWRKLWAELASAAGESIDPTANQGFSAVAEAEVDLVGADALKLMLDEWDRLPDAEAQYGRVVDDLTSLLKRALDLWALVGKADIGDDPSRFHQPSIRPHAQNQSFHSWTRLIDLVWRSWKYVDGMSRDASRSLVDRWRHIDYLTFQRLALQAIGESTHWNASEKLKALVDGLR